MIMMFWVGLLVGR